MKHEIDIPGLPEGWKAVAYRKPKQTEYVYIECSIRKGNQVATSYEQLIIEKINPRRILIEETYENRSATNNEWCETPDGFIFQSHGSTCGKYKIWREVKDGE